MGGARPDMTDRYTHCGKQVLIDGKDFAQARDNDAAEFICNACNVQENADRLAEDIELLMPYDRHNDTIIRVIGNIAFLLFVLGIGLYASR